MLSGERLLTSWEIAAKHRNGKWPGLDRLIEEFPALLRHSRFIPLPVSIDHARAARGLDGPHRDPFDRMLAAQSKAEQASVVSGDAVFRNYGADVIWS